MISGWILLGLILFAIGTAVGSFVNVVIYRTLNEESWATGRSRCDHCRKKIAWFDNIPIISYLVLGGKARCCSKPIPITYPIVETITGLLFVWWYWGGSLFFRLTTDPAQTIQPLFWLTVGVLLLLIFFADLFYLIIPDVAVGLLLMLTISYRVFLVVTGVMQATDLLYAVMGMILAVGMIGGLWLATGGKGMGLGDVKLAAPMALLLGWPNIVVGLFSAFILGGVVASVLVITGKRSFGQVVPFGPFLILSIVLALMWGNQLLEWYVQLLR